MVSWLYRLGLVPFWLCSLAPPGGSGWLLRPKRSASTVTGFLATQITHSQVQTTRDRVACKTLIGVLLGVLVAFKVCSCCFSAAANLFWESSAPSGWSGVEVVGVVVCVWASGRRPRGWGPLRARGRSPLRRSGSKPSLFRFISE